MANLKDKITSAQDEIKQLQNRVKEYEQRLKKEERKARDHRIFQRGGYIEKVLPETITLNEADFRKFIDKTLVTDFSRRILANLKAEQEKQAAVEGADETPQNREQPAVAPQKADTPSNTPQNGKPAEVARNTATTANVKPPEAARTAG